MSDQADPPIGESEETLSPEAAFSLLGDDIRLNILMELWNENDPVSFSDLRDRVGIRDSGQFNYHLDKLVGHYVTKTEEGYELRYAGAKVVGSVYSGAFTREVTVDSVPTDGTCYECGGGLAAHYEDEQATVGCTECDATIISFGVPPGIVEGREPAELPHRFDRWVRGLLQQTVDGFCPLCVGAMTPSYGADWEGETHGMTFQCQQCDFEVSSTVSSVFLHHPAVVAFHYDHGIDLSETPLWDLDWPLEDVVEVRQEDPLRFEVRIDLDDERLLVRADENFDVRETERTAIET